MSISSLHFPRSAFMLILMHQIYDFLLSKSQVLTSELLCYCCISGNNENHYRPINQELCEKEALLRHFSTISYYKCIQKSYNATSWCWGVRSLWYSQRHHPGLYTHCPGTPVWHYPRCTRGLLGEPAVRARCHPSWRPHLSEDDITAASAHKQHIILF